MSVHRGERDKRKQFFDKSSGEWNGNMNVEYRMKWKDLVSLSLSIPFTLTNSLAHSLTTYITYAHMKSFFSFKYSFRIHYIVLCAYIVRYHVWKWDNNDIMSLFANKIFWNSFTLTPNYFLVAPFEADSWNSNGTNESRWIEFFLNRCINYALFKYTCGNS